MEAELFDGTVLEFPDGTNPAVIQATVKKLTQERRAASPAAPLVDQIPGGTAPYVPPADNGTAPSDASVALNSTNKGIASLPDALLNLPNKVMNLGRAAVGTGAIALGRPDLAPDLTPDPNYAQRGMRALGMTSEKAEPTNARQRIIDAMVQGGVGMAVAPARSGGQLAANVLQGVVGGGAAGTTQEATGNDALAISAGMLAPVGANAAANRARQKVADAAIARSANEVRDQSLAAGREEGYVVSPSTVKPSFMNNRLESIAGKAALKQEATIRNQGITNKIAARELDMPEGTAITEGKLKAYRAEVAEPYREAAKLPTLPPDRVSGMKGSFASPYPLFGPKKLTAEQTVRDLKQARYDANNKWKEANRTGQVSSLEEAKALSAKVESLEAHLEATAAAAGKTELVAQLRDARQKIAKSYDIERSLNLGNADISAPTLGRALDNGAKLSGGLETIGKFQQGPGRQFMGEGSSVPTPGVSALEPYAMAGAGAAGSALSGGVGGIIAGGFPLIRGPVRSLLLSKPYQRFMASPDYSPGVVNKLLSQMPPGTSPEVALQAMLIARAIAERNQQGEQ